MVWPSFLPFPGSHNQAFPEFFDGAAGRPHPRALLRSLGLGMLAEPAPFTVLGEVADAVGHLFPNRNIGKAVVRIPL